MRKARIWRAFLIKERKFSENKNGWLTWEDSNFHIPLSKNAFEMSTELAENLTWRLLQLQVVEVNKPCSR
jgi:hypothetical protein